MRRIDPRECAGPDTERVHELLSRHAAEWAGPAVRQVYSCTFRRGFVEEVTLEARMFLDIGERLFSTAPIRLLRVIGRGTCWAKWCSRRC